MSYYRSSRHFSPRFRKKLPHSVYYFVVEDGTGSHVAMLRLCDLGDLCSAYEVAYAMRMR